SIMLNKSSMRHGKPPQALPRGLRLRVGALRRETAVGADRSCSLAPDRGSLALSTGTAREPGPADRAGCIGCPGRSVPVAAVTGFDMLSSVARAGMAMLLSIALISCSSVPRGAA